MRNIANTCHSPLAQLRRLHQAALLLSAVPFAKAKPLSATLLSAIFLTCIFTPSQLLAQTQTQTQAASADEDTIVGIIAQVEDTIIYDANGQAANRPPVLSVAHAPVSADEDINGLRIGAADAGRATREARQNLPEAPVDGRTRRAYETDPFEAPGITIGSFILRPSLDQGIRATNNAENSSSGSSAILSETTLSLNARSDWARHLATLDMSGTFEKSLSGQYVSSPRGQIDGALRLDLTDDTRINLGLGYSLAPENASDPNGISATRTRPLVQNTTAQAGLEHDIGKIFASAVARVNNSRYGKADLFNGEQINQSDRNNTYVSMTLRSGFEISAIIRPFAEVEVGRRFYQKDDGLDRNATQLGLRSGLQLNSGEKLNGEFSLGYIGARSADGRLRDTGGLSVDAAMNWSPRRGTDVRLGLRTLLESSPDIGGNSSILYLANIDVSRMIRSDLSLNARLDASVRNNRDGSGIDYGMGAEIGATYWFNRFFGVDSKLRHEFITSDVASRKYSSNSIYLGVKLRR